MSIAGVNGHSKKISTKITIMSSSGLPSILVEENQQRNKGNPFLRIAREPAKLVVMKEMDNREREFTVIYNRYHDKVKGFVEILGGAGKQDADDIVQEIFLRVWRNFQRVANIEDPEGYLFMMVRNRLFNKRREEETRRRIESALICQAELSANTTEEDMKYRELTRVHKKSVHVLPMRIRMAYVLNEMGGASIHEIAKEMNISEWVVKEYLKKGRKRVREMVKKW
jgi:RNA polymerase sigma factor (sigma-70 family)